MRERIALVLVGLILIGTPVALIGYQRWLRPALSPVRVIDIVAAVPEAGGFQPGAITVAAGETVTLRFSAADVTHGVAIGPALGIDLGQIEPGHVQEVTLTFDRAGTYTFYCNTWCSPNHWRMRGVVEVRSAAGTMPTPQRDPIIDKLAAEGVDIDANAMMDSSAMPTFKLDQSPSASRGAVLMNTLTIPTELQSLDWRRSHSPAQAVEWLASVNPTVNRTDLVDVVAFFWLPKPAPEQVKSTSDLYAKNCAACHGQAGDGKGPAASLTVKKPVAFADAAHMFTMRSDVLYAKLRRGGMGTDMPNFGTVFTADETWALVDYLWTLALKETPAQ